MVIQTFDAARRGLLAALGIEVGVSARVAVLRHIAGQVLLVGRDVRIEQAADALARFDSLGRSGRQDRGRVSLGDITQRVRRAGGDVSTELVDDPQAFPRVVVAGSQKLLRSGHEGGLVGRRSQGCYDPDRADRFERPQGERDLQARVPDDEGPAQIPGRCLGRSLRGTARRSPCSHRPRTVAL